MKDNWQCEYKIENPDSEQKIMIEWLFFDLAQCELQNVTIIDWGTKKTVGPFCGTETPPRWLSDTNQIRVIVKSGEIPDGISEAFEDNIKKTYENHIGYIIKVTRAQKGFESHFEVQMKKDEERAKNHQMGMGGMSALGGLRPMGGMRFPSQMAGGRLGPLVGGMGMGGGMRGPMSGPIIPTVQSFRTPMAGSIGVRPGMRPRMSGGRINSFRSGVAGTRRGMGNGIGHGRPIASSTTVNTSALNTVYYLDVNGERIESSAAINSLFLPLILVKFLL